MAKDQKKFSMLINLNRCVGCYACQVTCKAEHGTSLGAFRCRLEQHSQGSFPGLRKFFLPRLCNHCDNPPCVRACDENALSKNIDGVVVINRETCTACLACVDKCPYNAIAVDQFKGEPEKCDFCYSRIIRGELPVCAMSCMGKAIIFGDLNDENSDIFVALKKSRLKVLKPELGTHPSVFYTFSGDFAGSSLNDYDPTARPAALEMSATQNKAPLEAGGSTARMVNTSDVMCPSECGISVLVEDGMAKKIYGNKHSLVNSGAFCAKGASGLQMTYSPHRIRSPLIRAGARGEERWKEASWEEAIDYISKKLIKIKKKHGPESVFLDLGDVTDREALSRLFHAFGTPNTFNHGSICDPNRKWGPWLMTGDERPLPDLQRPLLIRRGDQNLLNNRHDAKFIVNLGVNPFVATRFNYMSAAIPAAREENGCAYIVIDPSHTNSAALSDMWFPIRPGTDGDLLAAMLHYILKNDSPDENSRRYINHDFMERYTVGWPRFKRAFLEYTSKRDPANDLIYFSLDWAEEKTGIGKADIEKIAHLFGITKPAAIEIGMHGTSHHTNGDVTSILMSALCLLTGNMDRPGGLVFIDSQKVKKGSASTGKDFLEKIVKRSLEGKEFQGPLSALNKDFYGDHPVAFKGVLADIPQKIRDGIELRHGPFAGYRYPLKAYISRAGNPVITAGNSKNWTDALTLLDEDGEYRLELDVFIDTHINVTGKYADVVLPEAGFLERMGVSDVHTMSPEAGIRDQVIKPLHESRTDFEIMIALSDGLIRKGDPDVKAVDFRGRYHDEEAFINEVLSEAPGFFNIGQPLPYPELPEGCRIVGIPENPLAILDGKVIREGEPLTVEWLRKNNGVAVWPTSYYRYKKADGTPSGIYPRTPSKKFEFVFSHVEEINRRLGTDFPTTFYWSDCKWNPKNPDFKKLSGEYPFQLVTGRVHHAMTATSVCPYLGETETECMRPLNESFSYRIPGIRGMLNTFGMPEDRDVTFSERSVSIPVFAVNRADGEALGIKTGDLVTLQNPLKKSIKGKVFLTDEIMPGVIKTAFGPGGQKASGIGYMNKTADYTPNINELHDPDNYNRLTGTPGFGDIMVKVIKDIVRDSDKEGT